jgi:hypothetical protein
VKANLDELGLQNEVLHQQTRRFIAAAGCGATYCSKPWAETARYSFRSFHCRRYLVSASFKPRSATTPPSCASLLTRMNARSSKLISPN